MASVKLLPPAIPVPFLDLVALLGKPLDDASVGALLATCGKVTRGKPDGGAQYVQCRDAGFDFLFRRSEGAPSRGSVRVLKTIFLYVAGRDRHRGYSFPYGITPGPRKAVLDLLGAPKRTWLIGKGEVPYTSKEASHDTWVRDGLDVVVVYGSETGEVRGVDVSLTAD